MMGRRGGGHFMQRHMTYMQGGLPPLYANLVNPLQPTPAVLSRGAELYGTYCASCHGSEGRGDGSAGQSLRPRPADIAASAQMPMGDNFLFWTIAEGGQPFGTAMPGFRDSLNPDEIWAIVTYLRAGLPSGRQLQ
ncbi:MULTISPECIES: c-type cytochrome [Azospirillum]|nr:c-type cytochrome [Azospirillum brasilense]